MDRAPEASDVDAADVRVVPIELLEPSPFQPRISLDPEAFEELVASIKSRGVLQPVLVRLHPESQGRYQIIAGERRWRAAQQAGLHDIPALVRPLDDLNAIAAALVENLQRQDLNSIEEAEGYNRLLMEFGLTQEALAQAVGKSRSHVSNTIRLLNLPANVQQEVRKGALSAGHARALLAAADPARAAIDVIARGLNVRQTEALTTRDRRPAAGPDEDHDARALEQQLAERLGMKVRITAGGAGGVLRISFLSQEQLEAIVTLLTRE